MTKITPQFLGESALAALAGIAVAAFIITVFLPGEKQPTEKFKVVDQYKGCDVVRYTEPRNLDYHYFLDCRK